jgi:hypothetical protein
MLPRRDIVKRVLDISGNTQDVAQAERTWFVDLRRQGGFRLTKAGLNALTQADLAAWAVPIDPQRIDKATVVEMNRRIQWPYFIDAKARQLILFNSRDAVMAQLYGDVVKWLESLAP